MGLFLDHEGLSLNIFVCLGGSVVSARYSAGALYTKSIASLELRHKEHNNDPYPLHNNTIDFKK